MVNIWLICGYTRFVVNNVGESPLMVQKWLMNGDLTNYNGYSNNIG